MRLIRLSGARVVTSLLGQFLERLPRNVGIQDGERGVVSDRVRQMFSSRVRMAQTVLNHAGVIMQLRIPRSGSQSLLASFRGFLKLTIPVQRPSERVVPKNVVAEGQISPS